MYTVCLRYSASHAEAQDLMLEGFMKVFDSLSQFRHEGSFEGWMRRIMVNQALQKVRKKSHLHALVPIEDVAVSEMNSAANVQEGLSVKELLHLIQTLPTTYRLVFNLYVFEGYSHKEIAQLLHISEGTSKSNLFDARKWLQEKIGASRHVHHPKSHYL